MDQICARARITFWIAFSLCFTGCGVSYAPLPPGSVAGRAYIYDYSPTAVVSGNVEQIWWCGAGVNPSNSSQFSDSIQYETIDLTTGKHSLPIPVLGETKGGWGSVFTCNPKVVRGAFSNPLGNGENFTYAMYYVGLGMTGNNFIGVAFSNNGKSWKKY